MTRYRGHRKPPSPSAAAIARSRGDSTDYSRNDALWLRLQIREEKKKNRREKRSKRNGTTNGGAWSNHRITYLGRGEFLRVWDEGQGTKKGKLYVKRDRFIDGGELSMIVICFVFFFFFFRFGKIYEKIFFFRFESNRNILIGFLCFII